MNLVTHTEMSAQTQGVISSAYWTCCMLGFIIKNVLREAWKMSKLLYSKATFFTVNLISYIQ